MQYASVRGLRSLPSRQVACRGLFDRPAPPQKISYTEFLEQVKTDQVVEAVFHARDPRVDIVTGPNGDRQTVLVPNKTSAMETLVEHGANVTIAEEFGAQEATTVFSWMLQFVVLSIIIRMVMGGGGAAGAINRFAKTRDNGEVKETGITFQDIAGAEGAKANLQEIVEFLKFPDTYARVGAKIPKGVLLYGPSGVGKTVLAKAVAGEAGVPFFSCSGSEFIEMFVGVGASRIRALFDKARKAAPCIIFIDEIDAIGKKRSTDGGGMGGGANEHDQTINQLLTAMDGFESNGGVIVIGATNRMEVLDEALLRPGRFDRRVYVEMPDASGRLGILQIHTRGKPLGPSIALESVARRTVGFSGADLESLCNEAAMYAARGKRAVIETEDFDQAFEKLTLGEERRTTYVSDHKKRVLSVHEAGHCMVGMLIEFPDAVHKVTIVPRGPSGGATYFEPHVDSDMMLETRDALEQRIMVAFGGRAAEEIIFGSRYITTGASGDLQNVYQIAHDMVVHYGFSENMGPVSWAQGEGVSNEIDAEIYALADRLYADTCNLLFEYRSFLEELAHILWEKETLGREFLEEYTRKVQAEVIERRKHDV